MPSKTAGSSSVIDMHLGREIVAEMKINTKTFWDAQEMLQSLQEKGLPEQCSIS